MQKQEINLFEVFFFQFWKLYINFLNNCKDFITKNEIAFIGSEHLISILERRIMWSRFFSCVNSFKLKLIMDRKNKNWWCALGFSEISVENSESWRDISALIRDFFRKIADFFIRGRSQNEMTANKEDGLYQQFSYCWPYLIIGVVLEPK